MFHFATLLNTLYNHYPIDMTDLDRKDLFYRIYTHNTMSSKTLRTTTNLAELLTWNCEGLNFTSQLTLIALTIYNKYWCIITFAFNRSRTFHLYLIATFFPLMYGKWTIDICNGRLNYYTVGPIVVPIWLPDLW